MSTRRAGVRQHRPLLWSLAAHFAIALFALRAVAPPTEPPPPPIVHVRAADPSPASRPAPQRPPVEIEPVDDTTPLRELTVEEAQPADRDEPPPTAPAPRTCDWSQVRSAALQRIRPKPAPTEPPTDPTTEPPTEPVDQEPPDTPAPAAPSEPSPHVPPTRLDSHNEPPTYPERARRLGHEGEALVALLVATDGSVASVRIARSSGHRLLDAAALTAARRWRFDPARENGAPAEQWVEIPVQFALR